MGTLSTNFCFLFPKNWLMLFNGHMITVRRFPAAKFLRREINFVPLEDGIDAGFPIGK
jgi:hypothetical protein